MRVAPAVVILALVPLSCDHSSPAGDGAARVDAAPGGGKASEGDGASQRACSKSGPEICDGVDNDCDGRVDESFVLLCGPCPGGLKGCVEAKLTGGGFWLGTARNLVVGNDKGVSLPPLPRPQPYIYVANSSDNTVSKIRTTDAVEVGRILVGPNPSRTAVDGNGDAWVAMRGDVADGGSGPTENVVKIAGDCIPKTKPPAASRECIILDVPDVGNLLRGLAIDARNDVWVGSFATQEVVQLDGATGTEKRRIGVPGRPYGLAIDPDGYLWISAHPPGYVSGLVLRVNLVSGQTDISKTSDEIGHHLTYGLAVDGEGGVWFGSSGLDVYRIDAKTGDYGPAYDTSTIHATNTRGVAVDDRGYLWAADSDGGQPIRVDRKTGALFTVKVGSEPVGVAVDHDGNIWSVNLGSNDTTKVSPDGKILATVPVGSDPYTYSDMTGTAYRVFRKMKGTFTATYDVGVAGARWKSLSWTGNVPPPATLSIRMRTADGPTSGAVWQEVALKGTTAQLSMVGSTIEIEIKLATDDRKALPNVESLSFTFER